MRFRRFMSILLVLSTFFTLAVPAYAAEVASTSTDVAEAAPRALIRATKSKKVPVTSTVANFEAQITVTATINDSNYRLESVEATSAKTTSNPKNATITYNTRNINYTLTDDGTGSLEGSIECTISQNGRTAKAYIKVVASPLGNNTFNLSAWQT